MKLRPVNILEIILASLLIISHLLRDQTPYCGLATALSGAILAMLYFYGGFFVLKSPGINIGSRIAYGVVFGASIIGMVFSFQSWVFGDFYVILDIGLLLLLAIIRLIASYPFKNPRVLAYDKGIVIRYIIIFIILIYAFVTYTPYNP